MHPIEHFCCQNKTCPDHGQRGHGNLYFRGWSGQGQRIRMVYCRTCKKSFSERKGTPNGTDRRQNGRKHRKTYGFSKDAAIHDAATYFIGYSYNFCWAVRTLEIKDEAGSRQQRTPAMAAGLADHVWTLQEWLTYPAKPC